jgi:hypothetical protein
MVIIGHNTDYLETELDEAWYMQSQGCEVRGKENSLSGAGLTSTTSAGFMMAEVYSMALPALMDCAT